MFHYSAISTNLFGKQPIFTSVDEAG